MQRLTLLAPSAATRLNMVTSSATQLGLRKRRDRCRMAKILNISKLTGETELSVIYLASRTAPPLE
jgi:hypothetical protein